MIKQLKPLIDDGLTALMSAAIGAFEWREGRYHFDRIPFYPQPSLASLFGPTTPRLHTCILSTAPTSTVGIQVPHTRDR